MISSDHPCFAHDFFRGAIEFTHCLTRKYQNMIMAVPVHPSLHMVSLDFRVLDDRLSEISMISLDICKFCP